MVTRIIVPTGCVRQLTIMAWVSQAAGVLSITTALATEHWLQRIKDGDHVGIFPCCPSFTCGKKTVSLNDGNIEAFTNIIIVGLLLFGLGLILSLTHACISWRNDKRTLAGLSVVASALVTGGGITLVIGAIEFAITIPGNMAGALRQECQKFDDKIQTGFSYGLFVSAAVAFILAGTLLFLISCQQRKAMLLVRRGFRPSVTVSDSSMPLETVSAHLESHGRLSPTPCRISESFNNSDFDTDAEDRQQYARIHRLSSSASPYQCDRLSLHASPHQRDRLSPNHQHDRLSPQSSPHQRDRLSPNHQHDRLSPQSSPHQRDRLSPNHQNDRLSPQSSPHQCDRLSPNHQHDRLSPQSFLHQHDRLSPHISPLHQHSRLSPHHQHDRLSLHYEGSGFQPLFCPPSYESLQELFLLNISADSELSECRETTELHNLHTNSSESAVQPPSYEDVLKTNPPPYKE